MKSKDAMAYTHTLTPPFGKFLNDLANSSLSDIGDREFVSTRPSVNIIESEKAYELHLAAPGLTRDAFEVVLKDGVLTISSNTDKDDRKFRRQEFEYARFKRTFKVGELIDVDGITAQYVQGILFLELPKKSKEDLSKTIAID